ncbi:MAG: LacI family transcriptional regulator [Chloroflexi bacterium]|nr:LacI family transcriptional regulator [Chloroflexota bacterium]
MATATLRDVAKLAGVSIGIASQALNNRVNVLPETRARVMEAAISLGYPVREALDTVAGDRPLCVIGMLTKHDYGLPPEVNPFFSDVQLGVESECRKHNISLMCAMVEVDHSNRPVVWPAMISEQRLDGLILIATFIEDAIDWIRRQINIPIVLLDSYMPALPYDSVVIDNAQGVTAAVNYLIDQGHTHIGLIGSNPASPPDIRERRDSYLRTLQVRGIPNVYVEDSLLTRTSAYEATQRLLKRQPQVTAVFGCNDDVTIGVMNAAHDMGLHVPGDLSVVGFDNIGLAKEVRPALTTIHVHKTWMGVMGVRRLIERTQMPDQPKMTVVISTQLIVRDSVRLLK